MIARMIDPSMRTTARAVSALLGFAIVLLVVWPAQAVEIKRVKSASGIEAWLVEEHSIPLVTVRFAFHGGGVNDPAGRSGLANLLAGTLDEGAGEMTSQAFQSRLKELAMRLSFSAGRHWFSGRLQTLTENRDQAFEMLRLALTAPRFDKTPVERVRGQILTGIRNSATDPRKIAGRTWMSAAFKDHVYARPLSGTADDVKAITADDLRTQAKALLRRDGLMIAVVGDIDEKTLARLLDEVFGTFPEKRVFAPVPEATVSSEPVVKITEMDVPQTVIQFGIAALKRNDKDFIPAYILNHILGGGGFTSRLYGEIREKRGLVYSVYSYLNPLERAGLFVGGAATRNRNVAKTIALVRSEIERMAEHGPTPAELKDAKTYLTGSYALRFDSSAKIASQLLGIQMNSLGIDYIDRRNGLIEAVTLEDVRRAARRFLKADNLIITLVGKPEGVTPVNSGG